MSQLEPWETGGHGERRGWRNSGGEAVDLVNLLFSFQGRINRAKYWLAVAIYLFLAIVLGVIAGFTSSFAIAALLAIVVYIPMLISGIAVGIKRLHDRNKSGWWLLLFYLVPAVLGWAGAAFGGMMNVVLSSVSFALSFWALVELGILRGTVGPNQYGPAPLAPKA
jgi:uncharacterized membrane protein YhaH (DUF805 family)